MTITTQTPIESTAAATFAEIEAAWNAGDGARFGRRFTVDADFVDIRGDHHQGRPAIAHGHDAIFASIYAGSELSYRVESTRTVDASHAVVVVAATLDVPSGPLVGVLRSRATAVLVEVDGEWLITSFHNTLRTGDPGADRRE